MFNFFRTHQRLMQVVLLILVLPSFVLIGVSGYNSYTSNETPLVKIGDSNLTLEQFDQARRAQLQNLQLQQGSAFDLAVANSPEARRQLLDALVQRNVLVEVATKEGLSVSDTVLRQTIASIPDFQVDGVFSPDRYNTLLNASNISVLDFEQSQRAELSLQRVLGTVAETALLPTPVTSLIDQALTSNRSVEFWNFQTRDYLKPDSITEPEVQAWYDQNKETLRLPQYVEVAYIVLDEEAARNSVPSPSVDELQAYYEQNKSRFTRPERLNLSHILVAVKADATDQERQAARARAEALALEAKQDDVDFADLAQKNSDDKGTARNGGALNWINRGTFPEMDSAMFSLRTGEVSSVVQSADGYHIFKANAYEPESVQPFAELSAQLEQEIRQQLAAQRFADMATQLTNLIYESPDSLQSTADALGLPIRHAQGVTRDGLLAAEQVGADAAQNSPDAELLADPRVRRALFSSQSLDQRQNAGVVEVAANQIVALRAETIHDSAIPPLEQVKSMIVQRLAFEQARQEAQTMGEQALASLQAGHTPASTEPVVFEQSVSRLYNQGLPQNVVKAIMAANVSTLPSYVGIATDTGYSVMKITDASVLELDAAQKDLINQQLRTLMANAEEQAALAGLRDALKVTELPAVQQALQSSDEAEQ